MSCVSRPVYAVPFFPVTCVHIILRTSTYLRPVSTLRHPMTFSLDLTIFYTAPILPCLSTSCYSTYFSRICLQIVLCNPASILSVYDLSTLWGPASALFVYDLSTPQGPVFAVYVYDFIDSVESGFHCVCLRLSDSTESSFRRICLRFILRESSMLSNQPLPKYSSLISYSPSRPIY